MQVKHTRTGGTEYMRVEQMNGWIRMERVPASNIIE